MGIRNPKTRIGTDGGEDVSWESWDPGFTHTPPGWWFDCSICLPGNSGGGAKGQARRATS